MIARLRGVLADKSPAAAVVMAGGVGYEVQIPLSTYYDLPEEGETVTLYIKTVVRDDAIELFGFLTPAEKEAFILLNTVSKIGPRLALGILSGIGPAELVRAVSSRDLARLSSVPGVGAKTAERLVLELKEKVSRLAAVAGDAKDEAAPELLDDAAQDAVSALLNLGYSRPEAQKAVARAKREAEDRGGEADLAALIRLSLAKLRKG